ncbi:MAG: hypothetical protein P8X98_02270 [Woeseiaceae bacterium]
MHRQKRRLCRSLPALAAGVGILSAFPVGAEGQHEFLLLPSADYLYVSDLSPPDIVESDVHAGVDVVYSFTGEHLRLLGEYLLSTDESELERLQLGWSPTDNSMLWVGRFHSPASFWISEFHHGKYLQTSITRPSLEQWEDENGATPSHITGLHLEFDRELQDEAVLGFAIAAGLGPRFVADELVAYDMLDPESGHGLSLALRASYRPHLFSPAQFGFVSSWNEINVEPANNPDLATLDRIDQLTAGVFVDMHWEKLRLISSLVYHHNNLRYVDGGVSDDYVLAYVQPEYFISDDFILFGRVDIGDGEDHSVYLNLLPTFISHRNMVGVRWDFAASQSLTFEFADTSQQGENFNHEHYKEFRLQWSAAIR